MVNMPISYSISRNGWAFTWVHWKYAIYQNRREQNVSPFLTWTLCSSSSMLYISTETWIWTMNRAYIFLVWFLKIVYIFFCNWLGGKSKAKNTLQIVRSNLRTSCFNTVYYSNDRRPTSGTIVKFCDDVKIITPWLAALYILSNIRRHYKKNVITLMFYHVSHSHIINTLPNI